MKEKGRPCRSDHSISSGNKRNVKRFMPELIEWSERHGHEALDVALVADEVVVHDEDEPAPARRAQRVQLGQHLLVRLRARHAAVYFDDVAELALERAAARILDAHRAVALKLRELE